jgi:hypothetical protein
VQQSHAVFVAGDEEPYCLHVDQRDFLEIQIRLRLGLLDLLLKIGEKLRLHSASQPNDHSPGRPGSLDTQCHGRLRQ